MKKFKIKNGKKTYVVKAKDKDTALNTLVEKGYIEKITDSDKLKQLAYEFGQKGAYFDRANESSSRNILGKDDEVKYQDFVNSGFKVYEQLKQEVDKIQKTGRSFGTYETYSDTLKLLKDGLERLHWASDNVNSSARNKGKALAEKLDNLIKEYCTRMHGIKDEESPERKAQEWVDYDLKHYGHVSEETKEDIKKMGLDYDKWDNQVKDATLPNGIILQSKELRGAFDYKKIKEYKGFGIYQAHDFHYFYRNFAIVAPNGQIYGGDITLLSECTSFIDNLLRSNKYKDNDTTKANRAENLYDSDNIASFVKNLTNTLNNIPNTITGKQEHSARKSIDDAIERIRKQLKQEFDSTHEHVDKVSFQASVRMASGYIGELIKTLYNKAKLVNDLTLSQYLTQQANRLNGWKQLNFMVDCDVKPISDCDMSNVEVKDVTNYTKYQYLDALKYIDDAWYKVTDNVHDGILTTIGLTDRVFDNAWSKLKNMIDKDDKLSDVDKAELERYF